MGFVNLGKQLAQEAIGNQVKGLMDSLRPPDASTLVDPVKQEKTPAAAPGEPLGGIISGQVQAMQRACKEDQELVVLCGAGLETLRVLEFYAPSPHVFVLTGIDADRNVTRVILPVHSVQLICKVMPVRPGSKPARVNFIQPKAKP